MSMSPSRKIVHAALLGLALLGGASGIARAQTATDFATTYRWDGQRRLAGVIHPDPDGANPSPMTAERYSYDVDGQLIEMARGTVAGTSDAQWAAFVSVETTTYGYDDAGNKIRETTPVGVTNFSYDADDRLTCTAVRMNPAVDASTPNNACALLGEKGAQGFDRITKTVYDAAGQVTDVLRGVGSDKEQIWSHATYSDNGQRLTVRDANHNRTTFGYDGFDRLVRQWFPVADVGQDRSSETDFEAYDYDANGNRFWFQKRDGLIFTYDYDGLNRPYIKHYPQDASRDVYTEYDLLGHVTAARFQNSAGPGVVMEYDKAGRLRSEMRDGLIVGSDYDAAGNRVRVTWPDGAYVDYDYNPASQLVAVREPGGALATGELAHFGYDDLGRRASAQLVDGAVQATYHFTAGQLDLLRYDGLSSGQPIWQNVTYNRASQVDTVTQHNPALIWTGHPTATTNSTANGLNQDAAIVAFGGYDLNGNLKFDGTRHFEYDAENRLTNVSGASSLTIAYDPLGRIRSTVAAGTTTRFLYDGDQLVGEYTEAGGTLRRYVHGVGTDDPLLWYEGGALADRRWLLADRQGSIVAHATLGGAAVLYTYGPYGEAQSWDGSRFRYTGQIALPEAELYHYKARAYDPKIGRFLQTDPVGYKDDLHLYAYVGNDPVNKIDPTGETVVIKGDDNYKKLTQAALDKIASQPGGAAAVKALKDSKFENTISKPAVGEGNAAEWGTATPGVPGSSNVKFNPENGTGGVDENGSNQRPAFVGLAHEIGHANAMNDGTQTNPASDPAPTSGSTPPSEKQSIKTENIVRKENELPLRPSYIP